MGAIDLERPTAPALVSPAYTFVDAARYTGVPAQTVRNWVHGVRAEGHSMREVFAPAEKRGLSYLQLCEIALVAQLRIRGVRLQAVRAGHEDLRERWDFPYPFAIDRILTDGRDLFVASPDDPQVVIAVSKGGQRVWLDAIAAASSTFDYSGHLPLRWHPRGKDRHIVVDPYMAFGRPTVTDTGIPTQAIADLHQAGEEIDRIAYEFGLGREQVRDALWFENPIPSAA